MRFYRFLLLAFPRRIRREYGEEMVRMFEAQLRTAKAMGNNRLRLWISAAADAIFYGLTERLGEPNCRSDVDGPRRGRWRSWMDSVRLELRPLLIPSCCGHSLTKSRIVSSWFGRNDRQRACSRTSSHRLTISIGKR